MDDANLKKKKGDDGWWKMSKPPLITFHHDRYDPTRAGSFIPFSEPDRRK